MKFTAPPKKSLGQHFLHEGYYIEQIVTAVNPLSGDVLVEIGPGQGAITLPLLKQHKKLTVIEFDRDLVAPLTAAAQPLGELRIIQSDVLKVDFTALKNEHQRPLRLVGNLPYNISTPILFHALAHNDAIQDMHFMLQKEVVDRMAAAPGSKVYGRLSVMLQAYCSVTGLFDVPPSAFLPPPKVDSAVVRLIPLPASEITISDHTLFADIVRDAFGQRRKTLRNALSKLCQPEHFEEAGISSTQRAEQLDVVEFITLSNTLARSRLDGGVD